MCANKTLFHWGLEEHDGRLCFFSIRVVRFVVADATTAKGRVGCEGGHREGDQGGGGVYLQTRNHGVSGLHHGENENENENEHKRTNFHQALSQSTSNEDEGIHSDAARRNKISIDMFYASPSIVSAFIPDEGHHSLLSGRRVCFKEVSS